MKHLRKIVQHSLATLVVAAAFGGPVSTASGQAKSENPAARTNKGGRDPFSKYVPPRVVPKKSNLVMPPSIQERIQQYKAQKQAAMSARVAAPKPTTAFLLSEVQVIGISRSPRGYAAIVEASPIKLAYVIYPGERFYDGQLVAIEDNRLVFRRETVFTDGRRELSVELKPLRQAESLDALTAAKAQTGASATVQEVAAKINSDTRKELDVAAHKIAVGMTKEEVLKAWGRPADADSVTKSGSGTSTRWTYRAENGSVDINFDDGVVSSYRWYH